MIKSVLHLLKIHRKVILGNTAIVVQNMFGKTPKTLDAVDVILGFRIDHVFRMINLVMFAQTLQGVVAAEGVGVIDRALPGFLADNGHEVIGRDSFHHPGIDLAVALQQSKYDVFALGTPSAFSFAPAAKIALVHFDFAVQSAALKLCHVVDRLSQALVHARDGLVVEAKVMRQAIGRLLLVEALDDGNLRSHPFQRLLFSAGCVPAPNISSSRAVDLKRTAENALLPSQKVSHATENVLSSCNHKDILAPHGYETH